ncbi:MAG: DUF5519 family protein [Anaerolineales bacterium]|nr:DUF5519 family protein [Anaerolineales bacterium]
MSTLREEFINRLLLIPDVTVERWKETDLLCVNYKGKEVAHFQTNTDCELDIRLSQKIIREERLTIPEASTSHPDRAKNSRWIIQNFQSTEDLDRLVRLVKLAIELR